MTKIVIIGAGVAGLSAGIKARLNGYDAVIVEKHRTPGGNLTGWDREGFHIDNCIHWLTGTNPLSDLYRTWQELGVLSDVGIYQADSLYTYRKDGRELSLKRDIRQLEADMLSFSEGDEKAIRSFLGAVRAMGVISGFAGEQYDRKPSAFEKAVAARKIAPYLTITSRQAADRFKSPMLRGFLRSLLSDHFSAMALLIVFSTFCSGNGGIPFGSSTAMARRMVQRFKTLGGELFCGSGAQRINIENGTAVSVMLENGKVIPTDFVILACEPLCAFGKLLDRSLMPKAVKRRYEDPRLKRFSAFHCAFSCEREALSFHGDLIVDLPKELQKVFQSGFLVLREFSHEKQFSPQGKSLIQAICFCPKERCEYFIRLKKDEDAYRRIKEHLCEKLRKLIELHCIETAGRLRCIDCWTPATYRRFTGSETGSFMSFALPPKMIPSFIKSRVRGVKNLFLANQWQQMPGGLPIAANAGIKAAEEIKKAVKKAPSYERGGEVFIPPKRELYAE